MCWQIAIDLARDFTVVCADLRGYGRSGYPASTPDHAPYAKGAMAADMIRVMSGFGFNRFAVALWSDRGGLATWYADEGGVLALWHSFARDVQGHAVRGGHFFPEETPEETTATLRDFFASR